ncbi:MULTISPECIES: AI-2E family transporter [unclassified Beijerinckia]|uniref:AI-2E family transporter n=1 Tax=unclassified Beijerinckia TaxID=2638183 RepID=UPI0008972CEC|nr:MULTISPECIES: AI-2E family transporter [unclassified Beijerinckia]MDH7798869.1 AI-2 transport protein TqsA [Beijerinckia sp. GAS462]SED88454.1 Predicted PurR-regulated permease PerM [Beijerinckia sp. 28-YEA-48]
MTTGKLRHGAEILIAIILAVAALSIASSVFAPIALALLIIALVWPLQKRLQDVLPRLIALAISMIVVICAFFAFGSLIVWAFGRVGRWIIADAARFQLFYDQILAWLDSHGIALAGVWTEAFNVGSMVRMVQTVTGRLNSTMSFWVVVLVYVLLGLLEVDDFASKMRRMRNEVVHDVVLPGLKETAAKIRRYMLIRTLMSVVTGVLVWAVAKLVGLQLAEEWGFIAFALNHIPFLGPLIATVFPTLFAATQFESWWAVILIFSCLNLVQFIVGSYVEPRVAGKALSISPVLVLFSVFFWSYLWGIFGAFIGVSITITLLTLCAHHPSTAWLAELFGAVAVTPSREASPP